MSGICNRYLITSGNVLLHHRKQVFLTSFFAPYMFSKQIRNNFNSVIPVKLAYISYESMNGYKNASKQPVIVLHGVLGSKSNWNSLSKAIHQQTNRKVITIDARNHGDSPHSTEMTYRHMAEDIVELMNDLGLEKATLLGHSMGGSVAMYVALNYPQLIEKLVVVDMSPVRSSPQLVEMEKIFDAMSAVKLDNVKTLSKARNVAAKQLETATKSITLCQFLTMNLVEADIGKFKWRVNLPVIQQNFAKQIAVFPSVDKVYNGPTLFIGGSKSDFIRVEDHDKIKQLFPLAKILYINGANHWVHVDKPTEFMKVATDFIN